MISIAIFLGQLFFSLLMYCLGTVYLGIALIPGVLLILKAWQAGLGLSLFIRALLIGLAAAGGYFLFGLSLLALVGVSRMILRIRLKEGNYPLFSPGAIKWAVVTALSLLVNFTFAEFILLTPFINVLFMMLGAKLGKNVQINSKYVFDLSLIEIGDNTVVGGWAFIAAHVVERGILKLKRVKIGRNVTIGSHAKIMPGCEIGDDAIIGASAVLLKNTKVEPGAVYFGVPAKQVKPDSNNTEGMGT